MKTNETSENIKKIRSEPKGKFENYTFSIGETIHVVQRASPEDIRSLKMNEGMGNFFENFENPPKETKKMLSSLAKENIVCIAYNKNDEIIGYLSVVSPDDDRFDLENVYQIGAIEVSKKYRKKGVAMELMDLFKSEFFDNKIVYTFCYSWHWDTPKNNKKTYRKKLLSLLHSQNFSEKPINDINIKMDEYNIFAVRYGEKTDPELIEEFKKKLI